MKLVNIMEREYKQSLWDIEGLYELQDYYKSFDIEQLCTKIYSRDEVIDKIEENIKKELCKYNLEFVKKIINLLIAGSIFKI